MKSKKGSSDTLLVSCATNQTERWLLRQANNPEEINNAGWFFLCSSEYSIKYLITEGQEFVGVSNVTHNWKSRLLLTKVVMECEGWKGNLFQLWLLPCKAFITRLPMPPYWNYSLISLAIVHPIMFKGMHFSSWSAIFIIMKLPKKSHFFILSLTLSKCMSNQMNMAFML